jgi:hypothetical protein
VAAFEVRCCASQRPHQARRDLHSCVQAAAAARVADEPGDITDAAAAGDGEYVICYLIADADGIYETCNEDKE